MPEVPNLSQQPRRIARRRPLRMPLPHDDCMAPSLSSVQFTDPLRGKCVMREGGTGGGLWVVDGPDR
jgi:hypothetical protein